MNYTVKHYFELYPELEKAYETPDGLLHPTEQAAKKWVENRAHKAIAVWDKPAKDVPAVTNTTNDGGTSDKTAEQLAEDVRKITEQLKQHDESKGELKGKELTEWKVQREALEDSLIQAQTALKALTPEA